MSTNPKTDSIIDNALAGQSIPSTYHHVVETVKDRLAEAAESIGESLVDAAVAMGGREQAVRDLLTEQGVLAPAPEPEPEVAEANGEAQGVDIADLARKVDMLVDYANRRFAANIR